MRQFYLVSIIMGGMVPGIGTAAPFGGTASGSTVVVQTVTALFLFFVAFVLNGLLRITLDRLVQRKFVTADSVFVRYPLLQAVLWGVVLTLVFFYILPLHWEIGLGLVLVIGLGVGFASKQMFQNVLSGLIILMEQTFQAGDSIQFQDISGKVIRVGLHSTRLQTGEALTVSIPNSRLLQYPIYHRTLKGDPKTTAVLTTVFPPPAVDLETYQQIAYEAALTSRYVDSTEPVHVYVGYSSSGSASLQVTIRAAVINSLHVLAFQTDVLRRIQLALMANPTG